MNPQDPLAALHPLREPDPISWWPPAPGWWVLGILLLVGLIVLTLWLRRRYHSNDYRRAALVRLDALHAAFNSDKDSARFAADTNTLLKSVALKAFPSTDVAPTHGENWLEFLNVSNTNAPTFPPALGTEIYTAQASNIDADALYTAARHWITHHRGSQ